MDIEVLARVQFALTIMFHYLFPPLSIGLGLLIVIIEGMYLKTKDKEYLKMAQFWVRVFALTFAIGVATGIVMEFEFGTNWAAYSRYVGDVFGSALAAEGVFAFFLESGFLALLLFGWDRISPRMHFFSALMVALGAHFSAIWIVVANSWMQTPAGYHIVGNGMSARAEITSFWEMVFNPSAMDRLAHVVVGCWLAGAFLMISVSCWYLLKGKHQLFAKRCLKISLLVAFSAGVMQFFSGDRSGQLVAKHQPLKLAALEGIFESRKDAPMSLLGVPSKQEGKMLFSIDVPGMLSYLAFRDFNAEVKGLNAFPKEDWPNVNVTFQVYHIMVYMWGGIMLVASLGLFFWWRGTLWNKRWFLRLGVLSVLFPQIANQTGWISAEMGRYPWIVYDLLRISDGLSRSVSAEQVLGSIIMFGFIYSFLFIMFIYLLDQKIRHGPGGHETEETTYHSLETYVGEKHGE